MPRSASAAASSTARLRSTEPPPRTLPRKTQYDQNTYPGITGSRNIVPTIRNDCDRTGAAASQSVTEGGTTCGHRLITSPVNASTKSPIEHRKGTA